MIKVLPWTWSKLNAFETCAYRHLKVDLQRVFQEEESDQLRWGNKVHKAIENALKPVQRNQPPGILPEEMAPFQKYVDRLARGAGELLIEQKYALTKDLQPCDYYSPVAWYRGKNDAVRVAGVVALAADWKTGKRKNSPTNKQLMLGAQCIFSYHPDVEIVQSKFIWLNEDKEDDETFTRESIANEWIKLLPRVDRMLMAAEREVYLPEPGGLCKEYCPVTACQFHGKGTR